jgi:flagellar basal-body rod modification protein FlgD
MTNGTSLTPQLSGLDTALTQSSANTTAKKKKNDEIGKNEFLNLLVTQLKNQDPLDPMKSEEFAVNLAQFSQLEQLVSINDKIGASAGTDVASMAGYLGQEVYVESDKIEVESGKGGLLKFDLRGDADVEIEILKADGTVAQRVQVGSLSGGQQTVNLADLTVSNGEYGYRIVAQGASGPAYNPAAQVGGVVTGFVPGPTPRLMLGNREVAPADIVEVRVPKAA